MMNEQQLIADMKATFPGIFARPLRDFSENYGNTDGVWTGGDDIRMPDGKRMFGAFEDAESDEFGIHKGFIAWLECRGWYIESWDSLTHHIVRLPTAEDIARWKTVYAIANAHRENPGLSDDGLPF